jgi:valyl-tRNA synthetase
VQTYSDNALKIVTEQKTSLKSLGGKNCGEIKILPPSDDAPPVGCALQSINADAAVYLKIIGRIDLVEELKKREKSLEDAKAKVDKSKKIMSGAGWEKAAKATREKEQEKLQDAEKEAERLEGAIKDLERLKLEK